MRNSPIHGVWRPARNDVVGGAVRRMVHPYTEDSEGLFYIHLYLSLDVQEA